MHIDEANAAGILRKIVVILCSLAGLAAAVYIGFNIWVNYSGQITEKKLEIEQGDAVSVYGADRRKDVFTLLIAATDEDGTRTDSIMTATFDMENKKIDIINIPRDTLVDTQRTADGKKINAAYGEGIEQLRTEVQSVIGYRPDKYIVFSFDGIAKMIDSIGGIDYKIPFKMSYHDASQNLSIDFKKGMQHLDGQQVVEFLRWRHNDNDSGYEDGDVGRVKKLQKFLKVLAKKVIVPSNIVKMPQLANDLYNSADTDLTRSELLWIGMQSMNLDMDKNVKMTTLAGDSAEIDINMGYYLWYFVVDEKMALEQINSGLNPFNKEITDLDIVTPYTIDGAYSPDWINEMACRYAQAGLDFTEPEDKRYDYDEDY